MNQQNVNRINAASFVLCLLSLICGMAVGVLGIWGVISASGGALWRALGTCGVLFLGAICASLAIRCFKTNDNG